MSNIKNAITKRKEFEAKLVLKALEDDNFRNKLLNNPKSVIEEELGKSLPDGVEVKVIEERPNTMTFVLPKKVVQVDSSGELSEESLNDVSGGVTAGVAVAAISETGAVIYGIMDED